MIRITDITSEVISIIQSATRIKVKTGWLTQEDIFPVITIAPNEYRVEWILQSEMARYFFSYEVSIWSKTLRETDEEANNIIDKFAQVLRGKHWFSFRIILRDMREGGIYRKVLIIEFGVVG
ncbi:MAG: hypothetical protein QW555_08020 [Nitrososphaerota archaeon]